MGFVSDNAAAVFGVGGVLLGGAGTFATSWLLQRADFKSSVWRSLLERSIAAHEATIQLALQLRVMGTLGDFDEDGNPVRLPMVLRSREDFESFFESSSLTVLQASPWLSLDALRLGYLVQDYVATLFGNTKGLSDEGLQMLGQIVRQDFVDLSSDLEVASHKYFAKEVYRRRLRDHEEWHKLPKSETEARLRATQLMTRWDEVAAIMAAYGSSQQVGSVGRPSGAADRPER